MVCAAVQNEMRCLRRSLPVLSELMPGDALVLMAGSGGVKEMDVASLLPGAFDKEDMQ